MLVGVFGMYAGESYSFKTDFTNPLYTVIGNSSNLEGMNITFENGNITVRVPINYKPDSFTIVFLDNNTKDVVEYVRVGGGTNYIYIDNISNFTEFVPVYQNITQENEIIKSAEPIIEYRDNDKDIYYKIGAGVIIIGLSGIIFYLIRFR